MMLPLVSIIIPGYKTESTIDECIRSVFEQDYERIQVILVDDGSPDRCPQIIDDYSQKYENVEGYHQKNEGLWSARNTGIRHAMGKYIFFLDSDDLLDGKSAISSLVRVAEGNDADITVGAYRRLTKEGLGDVVRHGFVNGCDTSTAKFRFKGFYSAEHLSYNWGKLYRKQFLIENDLMLKPIPHTQDKYHNMACCVCRPRYAFLDESVYIYRIDEKSVTFKYKADYPKTWASIAENLIDHMNSKNVNDEFWDLVVIHYFWGTLFMAKQEILFSKNKKIAAAKRILKCYANIDRVNPAMRDIMAGKYISGVDNIAYRMLMRGASILFCLKLYGVYALLVRFIYRI